MTLFGIIEGLHKNLALSFLFSITNLAPPIHSDLLLFFHSLIQFIMSHSKPEDQKEIVVPSAPQNDNVTHALAGAGGGILSMVLT